MIIEVTPEDIANGVRCRSSDCPIAHATERALGHPVFADGYGIRRRGDRIYTEHLYRLSRAALRRMRRYDDGKGMEPFRFRLLPVKP